VNPNIVAIVKGKTDSQSTCNLAKRTLHRHIVAILYKGPTHAHPVKSAPSGGGLGPHLIRGTMGPYEACLPNDISIGSSVFAQFICVPNRPTLRPRYVRHVYKKEPHLCIVCGQRGPIIGPMIGLLKYIKPTLLIYRLYQPIGGSRIF